MTSVTNLSVTHTILSALASHSQSIFIACSKVHCPNRGNHPQVKVKVLFVILLFLAIPPAGPTLPINHYCLEAGRQRLLLLGLTLLSVGLGV